MTKIAPNPHSPYADADPETRHIFANPIFFPSPNPGVLALTACEGMAVVPTELVETEPGAPLPEGLCAACVAVMQGGRPPERPSSECSDCGSATWHGALCALCRQDKHETWWPTRNAEEQPAAAPADQPAPWPTFTLQRWNWTTNQWDTHATYGPDERAEDNAHFAVSSERASETGPIRLLKDGAAVVEDNPATYYADIDG